MSVAKVLNIRLDLLSIILILMILNTLFRSNEIILFSQTCLQSVKKCATLYLSRFNYCPSAFSRTAFFLPFVITVISIVMTNSHVGPTFYFTWTRFAERQVVIVVCEIFAFLTGYFESDYISL